MWFAAKEQEVKKLEGEGFELLERGDFDGALSKGRALLELRWSGGFELVALALRAKGDRQGALAALDEASHTAPAWSLAQLRGNVLDELGRPADAVVAYDEALGLRDAWRGSIQYNRAVALATLGRWGEALRAAEEALEDARGAAYVLSALRLAVDALAHLGRHDDALALLDHVAAADEAAASPLTDLRVGALSRAGRTDEARWLAETAVEDGTAALEAARVLCAPGASAPRTLAKVVFRGPPAAGATGGYLRVALVRAQDPDEALLLMRSLEPTATRTAVGIESFEPERAEDGPAQVLSLTGRVYFED